MAEPVIGGALLRVLERVIGLADFLELGFGLVIARIAIRMELHGELAISALEGTVIGALLAAENLVEVAFGQEFLLAPPMRGRSATGKYDKRSKSGSAGT